MLPPSERCTTPLRRKISIDDFVILTETRLFLPFQIFSRNSALIRVPVHRPRTARHDDDDDGDY